MSCSARSPPTGACRASQVPQSASLHTCPVLRPRQTFGNLACNDSSVLASVTFTTSPSASTTLSRLNVLRGGAASPTACMVPCVRFVCFVRRNPRLHSRFRSTDRALSIKHPRWRPCRHGFVSPPHTQHSVWVGGQPLPNWDSHPARSARLSLAHECSAPLRGHEDREDPFSPQESASHS